MNDTTYGCYLIMHRTNEGGQYVLLSIDLRIYPSMDEAMQRGLDYLKMCVVTVVPPTDSPAPNRYNAISVQGNLIISHCFDECLIVLPNDHTVLSTMKVVNL